MTRCFVALWPTDEVVARLEELHRKDQVGVRFVPPENWHVTLRFLGDVVIDEVAAALDGASFEPTTIRLGPAVDLLGERQLVVPAAGADDLAAEVVSRTVGLGSERVRRRFVGHLTIARLKRNMRNMPRVLGELVDAEWTPTEVALVRSTLHPDGARYTTDATWPIGS